jgi:hypothetical protein
VFSRDITHACWNQWSVTALRSDGRQATNLDQHNHRHRTASSLSGTRSWCRTCFHNWGKLYSLCGTDRGWRNSCETSM